MCPDLIPPYTLYRRWIIITRETRVGWSLLTVETEANGDSWSTYRALAALVCPVQHIFFLIAHFFTICNSPHRPQQPMQAVVLGRLSLSLYLDQLRAENRVSLGALRPTREKTRREVREAAILKAVAGAGGGGRGWSHHFTTAKYSFSRIFKSQPYTL
jgi:hypothetical protein